LCFLGLDAVQSGENIPTFGDTNFLYFQSKRVMSEDGSSLFLQNIGIFVRDHTNSYSADSIFQTFSVSVSCVAAIEYPPTISLAGKGGRQVKYLEQNSSLVSEIIQHRFELN
jgi:hypothetical protein